MSNATIEAKISKGQIVKLKFGKANGRQSYRGRVLSVIPQPGLPWDDAVVCWFRDARIEMGPQGTFPTDELLPA